MTTPDDVSRETSLPRFNYDSEEVMAGFTEWLRSLTGYPDLKPKSDAEYIRLRAAFTVGMIAGYAVREQER